MGDPKRLRKQYSTPIHPWQKSRLEEEKAIKEQYGLKNKKEVWKMHTILKKYYAEAKRLVASRTKQADVEKELLLKKLFSYNLIKANAEIHEVLEIGINDLLNRRLQTILVKKGLARNSKQARQLIVHGHVAIGSKKMTSPSYLVRESELKSIGFLPNSPFFSEDHPERFRVEKIENVKAPKSEEKAETEEVEKK